MPANDALLASLLLGQKQRRDPLEIYQSFGRGQMQAGSSTAPLGSGNALEGIARALQGGLGGLVQGYALNKQDEQDTGNIAALTKATTAGSPEAIAEALKGVKGNSEMIIPVLGQIIQGRLDQTMAQQKAGTQLGPLMGGAMPGAPTSPPMQQGGGASPQGGIPQPGYAASSGGISSNNVGNITNGQGGFRQYPTPQAGAADAASLLRSYPVQYNNGQPMTLTQIGARYTPADDGRDPMLKGNDPTVWARNVGQIAGLDPNAPLDFDDPAVLTKVVNGINAQEKGRGATQAPQILSQGVAQAMDPTAFLPPSAQAAPGNPGPIAPQPAQGAGPTPAAPQGAPTAMSSPAGDQLRQRAQASQQAGDNVTALRYAQEAAQEDAKWSTEVGKKNLDQVEEERRHQRGLQDKKDNPQYTQEQNLSHTYATRLNNAIPQLEALIADPKNIPSAVEMAGANSSYYPEGMVSGKAKEYRRIVKDILSSTLRRESGASIADSEYASETQKFIPQAGDPPNVVANKLASLKQAARSIAEGTGRPVETYSFFGGAPKAGSMPAPGGAGGGGIPAPPPGFRPL